MSRNGSGAYSVPNTFAAGTSITASGHNQNWSDIASEMTNSVAADGQTTMSGPLKAALGSSGSPSYTFAADADTGFYRKSSNVIAAVVGSAEVIELSSTGASITGDVAASGVLKQAGFAARPVGEVTAFAGSSAPSGWLLCYGQAVSRTTYAALFAVIGTTYGTGDGSTTFNIPDLRGRTVAGIDNMGGSDSGRLSGSDITAQRSTLGGTGGTGTHTLTQAELPTSIGSTPSTSVAGGTFTYDVTAHSNGSAGGFSAVGPGQIAQSGLSATVQTTNITVTSMSVTNSSGGTAHNNVQPTILLNQIIFAGA